MAEVKKKFVVVADYHTTVWFEVEAKDLKAAKAKVKRKGVSNLQETDWSRQDLIGYEVREGE